MDVPYVVAHAGEASATSWMVGATANGVTAIVYALIAWVVFRSLVSSGQLRQNRLGLATAAIFITCAGHHGHHAVHMLLPSLGVDTATGVLLRESWGWHIAGWDVLTAAVGIWYLTLRRTYASFIRGAAMFADLRERQRQALELNDAVLQSLAQAQMALAVGDHEQSQAAIRSSMSSARAIITDLVGDITAFQPQPGDFRRTHPALADATTMSAPGSDGDIADGE